MTVPECATLEIGDQGLQVRMPGGATLQVMTPEVNPNNLQIAKNLLTQANAGLAPMAPIFSIIDALLAVKAFADAVPDSLGPPPDPTALAQALKDLAVKISALARLIPQLSVPFMIIDVIDTVIFSLRGVISTYEGIIAQELKITEAELLGQQPGNEALLQVTVCAKEVNAQVKAGVQEGLAPINSLMSVLTLFLELIGAGPAPSIGQLPDDSVKAISQLNGLVLTLEQLRKTIPIP